MAYIKNIIKIEAAEAEKLKSGAHFKKGHILNSV